MDVISCRGGHDFAIGGARCVQWDLQRAQKTFSKVFTGHLVSSNRKRLELASPVNSARVFLLHDQYQCSFAIAFPQSCILDFDRQSLSNCFSTISHSEQSGRARFFFNLAAPRAVLARSSVNLTDRL